MFSCGGLVSIGVLCLIVELRTDGRLGSLWGGPLHCLIAQEFIGEFSLSFVHTDIFRWTVDGMYLNSNKNSNKE